MTVKEEEEFVIKDEGKKPDKKITGLGDLGKLLGKLEDLENIAQRANLLGISERIIDEDRDASAIFNDEGICELHGMRCEHPMCTRCEFVKMRGKVACAIMDNINAAYRPQKRWRKDVGKAEGDGIPEGIHGHTGEL